MCIGPQEAAFTKHFILPASGKGIIGHRSNTLYHPIGGIQQKITFTPCIDAITVCTCHIIFLVGRGSESIAHHTRQHTAHYLVGGSASLWRRFRRVDPGPMFCLSLRVFAFSGALDSCQYQVGSFPGTMTKQTIYDQGSIFASIAANGATYRGYNPL